MGNEKKTNYLSFVINYNIILLIPMLIVVLSTYFVVKEHNLQRVMTEAKLKTESQSKYWEQEMSVLSLHYNDCRYSKLYSPTYNPGFPVSYLDIMQDLKEKESVLPFVDRLYFCSREERRIFSSDGTYNEKFFFSGRCRMDEKLLDTAWEEGMAAGKASFYSGSREGMVLVFSLRSKTEIDRPDSDGQYLLVTITRDKLMEQFTPRGTGGITAITWQDDVIYQSMEGISLEEGVEDDFEIYSQEMTSGFTVRNYIPKAEITRDGMRYLKSYVLWILVSLVVGLLLALIYSRRRYVFFHGLVDHTAALENQRNALQAETCLYELLTLDLKKGDDLWRKCLESGVHIDRKSQYIILFSKSEENERLKDYFVGMKREDPYSSAYKINLFGDVYIWLVLSCEEPEEIEQKLEEYAAAGAVFERGEIVSDAGRIRESYEETIHRVNRMYSKDDYPRMEMESLKEAIMLGEDSRMEILLRELRGIIAEADEVTAVLVSIETMNLLGVDFRKFYLLLKGRRFSGKDILRAFDCAMEEYRTEETAQSAPVVAASYRKRSITDILAYLHEHYLDPGFSVKYMASCFDTSVSNLSHFFKKNMGESISSYVDRIKLDKAKQLLRETDMRVGEIADLLQYGSSTGFAIMFKKYEGMTPKEYRENM